MFKFCAISVFVLHFSKEILRFLRFLLPFLPTAQNITFSSSSSIRFKLVIRSDEGLTLETSAF